MFANPFLGLFLVFYDGSLWLCVSFVLRLFYFLAFFVYWFCCVWGVVFVVFWFNIFLEWAAYNVFIYL